MLWRWMIAKCVWDETTKLGQYRRYQSWDSLGEYRLKRKGRVKEIGFKSKYHFISHHRASASIKLRLLPYCSLDTILFVACCSPLSYSAIADLGKANWVSVYQCLCCGVNTAEQKKLCLHPCGSFLIQCIYFKINLILVFQTIIVSLMDHQTRSWLLDGIIYSWRWMPCLNKYKQVCTTVVVVVYEVCVVYNVVRVLKPNTPNIQ